MCAEEIREMSRPLMRQGISVLFPSEFCPLMQSPTSHREVLLDPKILLSKVKGKNFPCFFVYLAGWIFVVVVFLSLSLGGYPEHMLLGLFLLCHGAACPS